MLEQLKPGRVFYYFERIASIPHGSHHTKQISEYITAFAREQGLSFHVDGVGNVIIRKAASEGYEDKPIIILQGHMDMVCVKEEDCKRDLLKDGLKLVIEGDTLSADGTSLGADDGIAVAMMMAILEDRTLAHPALEAVFTVDEEVGMIGAANLDYSLLKGRTMINLDNEEEGVFVLGCAGGLRLNCHLDVSYNEVAALWFDVKISGLKGGHSGCEINQNRGNAALFAGRLLYTLSEQIDYALSEFSSGEKDNAIPRSAALRIGIDEADEEEFFRCLRHLQQDLRLEYEGSDPNISIKAVKIEEKVQPAINPVSLQKLVFFLMEVPDGVVKNVAGLENQAETSSNLGISMLTPSEFFAGALLRSSHASAKYALRDKICFLTEFLGGECEEADAYPEWSYRSKAKLTKKALDVYKKMYGIEPKTEVIHAGLECGLFDHQLDGLECISYGPDMKNIHTTEEALSISSVERVYEYTLQLLSEL